VKSRKARTLFWISKSPWHRRWQTLIKGDFMRLKNLRMEIGLSQVELSLAANVPRYVISLFESGISAPSQEHLERLATTLGVPVEVITGLTSQSEEKR
jgi:transcriptional regulator with XRE-family HTH domain